MADDLPPRRAYRSERRQAQAEQTRARVLQAARELFARDGYFAAVGPIAERASVAPQTVYAVFGNKAGLLRALVEEVDATAGRAELIASLRAAMGDPERQIRLVVDFDLVLYTREADVLAVAHAARGADLEVAAFVAAGRDRGRQGRRPLVASWEAAGRLAEGLTVDQAVEAFLALCSFDLYRMMVVEGGWPVERYADWLTAAVCRALLRD